MLIKKWQQFRSRWWINWSMDITLMLVLFWGISAWQSRDLLSTTGNIRAPEFELIAVDGKIYRLHDLQTQSTLLYFFAPWCQVCRFSIGNLEKLRQVRSVEELSIIIIALDWQDLSEVKQFIAQQQLTLPVLMGTPQIAQAYHIKGFPTYYVLDANGYIIERSMGYSTELGLRLRT
jgi:peroxiredoxin